MIPKGGLSLTRLLEIAVPLADAVATADGPPQPLTVPAAYIRDFSLSADGRLVSYATLSVTKP